MMMMTTVMWREGVANGDLMMMHVEEEEWLEGCGEGEVVVDVLEAVSWTAQVSPAVRGKVAAQDEVMYCQKMSLVHSP